MPNEFYPHINIPDAIAYNSSGAVIGGYDAGSQDANNVIGGMSRTHTNPHHDTYFTTYHSPSGVTGSNLEVSLNGAYDITRVQLIGRDSYDNRLNGVSLTFFNSINVSIANSETTIPDNTFGQGVLHSRNPNRFTRNFYPAYNDGPLVLSQSAYDTALTNQSHCLTRLIMINVFY